MRKFERIDSPEFLIRKWVAWGVRYRNNRRRNPVFNFQWYTHEGQRINLLLEPPLKLQTDNHCSFCDNFPIRSNEDSIDHFKPKSLPEYYELVCQWENLYYSCSNCQSSKKEQYFEGLLRPDNEHFSFNTFFIYSYNTHKIDPKPDLDEAIKERVQTTINIFGLNDPGHIAARRISLERYNGKVIQKEDIDINDFPYRFTIE